MKRIKFNKTEQRRFLKKAVDNLMCGSLRGLLQFGINVNYSTLKNYFSEARFLPEELFLDLCYLAKIKKNDLRFEVVESNWGQSFGGKKSRKIQ